MLAKKEKEKKEKEVFPLKEGVEGVRLGGGGVSVMETHDTMGASIKTPFSNSD